MPDLAFCTACGCCFIVWGCIFSLLSPDHHLCKTESCIEVLCGPLGPDVLFPLFKGILLCCALVCDLKINSNLFPFLLALVSEYRKSFCFYKCHFQAHEDRETWSPEQGLETEYVVPDLKRIRLIFYAKTRVFILTFNLIGCSKWATEPLTAIHRRGRIAGSGHSIHMSFCLYVIRENSGFMVRLEDLSLLIYISPIFPFVSLCSY